MGRCDQVRRWNSTPGGEGTARGGSPGSFTPTPHPPWKLAPKCRTIGAKGALRQICLSH